MCRTRCGPGDCGSGGLSPTSRNPHQGSPNPLLRLRVGGGCLKSKSTVVTPTLPCRMAQRPSSTRPRKSTWTWCSSCWRRGRTPRRRTRCGPGRLRAVRRRRRRRLRRRGDAGCALSALSAGHRTDRRRRTSAMTPPSGPSSRQPWRGSCSGRRGRGRSDSQAGSAPCDAASRLISGASRRRLRLRA